MPLTRLAVARLLLGLRLLAASQLAVWFVRLTPVSDRHTLAACHGLIGAMLQDDLERVAKRQSAASDQPRPAAPPLHPRKG